jgi:hypothetical protein
MSMSNRSTPSAQLHEIAVSKRIAVYQCPAHRHMHSICIEGSAGGTRVLGAKCCPRQYSQQISAWPLTEAIIDTLVDELEYARAAARREEQDG